jgi:hypothetical protein
MPLKALLCCGDDASPQRRSVLRAIHTLSSLKKYTRLLRGLSPIHSTRWRGAKGLRWGIRGPYPPSAAMVDVGSWRLHNVRSTHCRNSKNCLWKYFFYSYVDPICIFLTSDPAAK